MRSNLQIKENNNQFLSAFQRLFLNTAPKPTANDSFLASRLKQPLFPSGRGQLIHKNLSTSQQFLRAVL